MKRTPKIEIDVVLGDRNFFSRWDYFKKENAEIFKVFAVGRKPSISLLVWTPWHVWAVESYAL